MRFLLIAGLSLLLAGCPLDDDSSSNNGSDNTTEPTPDTSTPDAGDNGGDTADNGGDTPGDSAEPTTPDVVDCDWQQPADVTPAETLGNTADAAIYSLDGYSERTDLDSDLTGTWVMVHKVSSTLDSVNTRTTTIFEQKTHFVIRDNAGQLEVSACTSNGSGFEDLDDFNLPLFGIPDQPSFSKVSNSRLAGLALSSNSKTFSEQSTAAIKISEATSAFGQSSLTFDASSEANADTFCFTQRRERSVRQDCAAEPQATTMSLFMFFGTDSGQQGISYYAGAASYYGLNADNALMVQTTAPASNSISASATAVSVNIALDDAYRVSISGAPAATGSLLSILTLP